ncbi:MAG: efflux RND transporter periplasmic adaptor subunit [Flavobacteriaceae bacterium]
MKTKSLLIVGIFAFMGCDSATPTHQEILASDDLELLQKQRSEYNRQISQLNVQLEEINAKLSTSETEGKLALITAFVLEPQAFDHFISVQGNVKTRQHLELLAEFGGVLKKIFVKEGQQVKKGSLLAQIDDAGMTDQLEQLQLQLQLAQTTFERTKRLWDQKIGSEMSYLQTKINYETQQKRVAQMKEQLAKTKIYAPFSGVIDEIIAKEGEMIAPGTSRILRIVNLNSMYVVANVPESYLPNIKIGSPTTVTLPVLKQTQQTTIRQTGNYIAPSNRTFRVEAPLQNEDGMIKPNLTARLEVNDYNNPQALLIPLRIINENAAGQTFVYKLSPTPEENVYTTLRAPVILGKNNGEKIEVLSGLAAGDLILEEGSSGVDDQQKVKRIQ